MGRIKDYIIWHEDEYGYSPVEWEHLDEYLHQREPDETKAFDASEAKDESTIQQLVVTSPSIQILLDIQSKRLSLEEIEWRQFEEIVAELLQADGYIVTLTKRTRDGGLDIAAEKFIPKLGNLLSVWQAKKLKEGNKVGIKVVRELADTRSEMKASKGVIVTSTSLTRDAIKRIQRDQYVLEGFQKPELLEWIRNYKR